MKMVCLLAGFKKFSVHIETQAWQEE